MGIFKKTCLPLCKGTKFSKIKLRLLLANNYFVHINSLKKELTM